MADPSLRPTIGGDFIHNNNRNVKPGSVLSRLSLKGKTAIITGAGAGIGLAIVTAYAEFGCNIAIWYNSNNQAIQMAEDVEKTYKVKCKAYQVDVRKYEAVEAAVENVVADFDGRLDIFVANAGIPWKYSAMLDAPVGEYSKVMVADLDSVYFCARAAGKQWRRQKLEGTNTRGETLQNFNMGSFIATASISGIIVNIPQLHAPYNAAKAGVIHLCRSLAVEWAQFARVNSVSPGYIITDINHHVLPETKKLWQDKTPLGREGEAHELQGAFLYLASDLSSYTTGADMVVDGGYCAP